MIPMFVSCSFCGALLSARGLAIRKKMGSLKSGNYVKHNAVKGRRFDSLKTSMPISPNGTGP
jgi:hypothetical protein